MRFLDLCNAIEDLDEDEKKTELAPILAQEVFVLIKLGRIKDGMALSKELDVEG